MPSTFEAATASLCREPIAVSIVYDDEASSFQLSHEEQRISDVFKQEQSKVTFRSGRAAAKSALEKLGIANPPPVLRGERREPLWPEGVVGSITHDRGVSLAAVAWQQQVAGVGVDLLYVGEKDFLPHRRKFCTETEKQWLQTLGADESRFVAALGSMKESTFKAIYPQIKKPFWFHAARFEPQGSVFRGTLLRDLSPAYPRGYSFDARIAFLKDYVLSFVVV